MSSKLGHGCRSIVNLPASRNCDVGVLSFFCFFFEAFGGFNSLRWTYWEAKPKAYFPEKLQGVLNILSRVRLCVDNYTFPTDYGYPGYDTAGHTRSIPAANLISLTAWTSGRGAVVEPLQDLLVASHCLETLTFKDMPGVFSPMRGRIPPIRRLALPGMIWPYTVNDVNMIWDFSRLEDLEIRWHVLGPFLESVTPKDLCQLKRLHVDKVYAENDRLDKGEGKRYQKTVTRLLRNLLEVHCGFEDLDIKCLLHEFDISLIARQGRSLRVLKLLDSGGFYIGEQFPALSLSSLWMLQNSCLRINTLVLGVKHYWW